MTSKSQALLDLHVQFELNNFSTEQFQKDLELELKTLFEHFADHKLNQLVQADNILTSIQNNILETKLQAGVGKLIKQIAIALYSAKAHDNNGLNALISREQVESFIDKGLSQESLRQELIHQGMGNTITHEIIAELLYSGISRYLTESNAITQKAQKVPGAKAMMKMSKGIINKAAPKLEEKVEQQVKKYIGIALPDVIAQSEEFISASITEEHIKEIALGIWDSMEDQPISIAQQYLSQEDIEDYVELGYQQFLSTRHSDYVLELVQTGVNSFFKYYGNKKVSALLKDFAVSPEKLVSETMPYAETLLPTLLESSYLEQRIRARLERFYGSPEAAKILV